MTYGPEHGQQDQSWQHRYDLREHEQRLRELEQRARRRQQQAPQAPVASQRPPAPQGPPPPPAPPSPPRTGNTAWKVLAGLGGFVIVIFVFSLAAHRADRTPSTGYVDTGASSAMVAATSKPASHAASAATPGRAIATFTGSGIENTPKFTVTATWKLDYTFDCSSFGGQGNFQVFEDGGKDTSLVVNILAASDTASAYAYDDAGTHYLEITSECAWTVQVMDAGS